MDQLLGELLGFGDDQDGTECLDALFDLSEQLKKTRSVSLLIF